MRIVSVGFEIHPESVERIVDHDSGASLDDADIVLFSLPYPSDQGFELYQGLPSLGNDRSFKYRGVLEHWRQELQVALEDGKIVFVELGELFPVYLDTGRREYSGTGRNQQTTVIVEQVDRYASLPFKLPRLTAGAGDTMRVATKNKEFIDYWNDFGETSAFSVRFESDPDSTLATAGSGQRATRSRGDLPRASRTRRIAPGGIS
jgi:hypothetical protein